VSRAAPIPAAIKNQIKPPQRRQQFGARSSAAFWRITGCHRSSPGQFLAQLHPLLDVRLQQRLRSGVENPVAHPSRSEGDHPLTRYCRRRRTPDHFDRAVWLGTSRCCWVKGVGGCVTEKVQRILVKWGIGVRWQSPRRTLIHSASASIMSAKRENPICLTRSLLLWKPDSRTMTGHGSRPYRSRWHPLASSLAGAAGQAQSPACRDHFNQSMDGWPLSWPGSSPEVMHQLKPKQSWHRPGPNPPPNAPWSAATKNCRQYALETYLLQVGCQALRAPGSGQTPDGALPASPAPRHRLRTVSW